MRHPLCIVIGVPGLVFPLSHAAGECIRYMSTCDGCGTWTDELSLLARGGGQGSSQLDEEGVRPFEFMTVGF